MFRNPAYLLALFAGVAAAAGLHALRRARRGEVARALGRPQTLERLLSPQTPRRRRVKTALSLAGLALLFLALAGPQWGVELVATRSSSRQVMIAVDTSLSMLTEDVKPNRMERAKQDMAFLLEQLRGDRVGVIAFAGEPAVVCPLTTDVDAAKQLLSELSPGMVPVPGTGIGKAIRLADSTLSRYPGQKALVILSDGEDHQTDPQGAAEEAAAHGIRIYAVGVGTLDGGPIPLRDASGALTGYKKDRRGQTVVSRLGEKTLADVAARSHGAYYRSSPAGNEISDIASAIEKQASAEGVQGSTHFYRNRFLFPLSGAFLLLLAELLLPEKEGTLDRVLRLGKRLASERGKTAAEAGVLLLALAAASARAASEESALRQGNRLYAQGQYEQALANYALAGQESPRDARPVFNGGDALYRLGQYDRSSAAFSAVAGSSVAASVKADAFYNLGNSRFSAQDYAAAVQAYRQALIARPDDQERFNLAVALHYLKNPPPKRKKNQPQQKQNQPKPQDRNNPSGGQNQPPPPKPRPQDQLSREDAQRIMQAVADRERAAKISLQNKRPPKSDVEEDW